MFAQQTNYKYYLVLQGEVRSDASLAEVDQHKIFQFSQKYLDDQKGLDFKEVCAVILNKYLVTHGGNDEPGNIFHTLTSQFEVGMLDPDDNSLELIEWSQV